MDCHLDAICSSNSTEKVLSFRYILPCEFLQYKLDPFSMSANAISVRLNTAAYIRQC